LSRLIIIVKIALFTKVKLVKFGKGKKFKFTQWEYIITTWLYRLQESFVKFSDGGRRFPSLLGNSMKNYL